MPSSYVSGRVISKTEHSRAIIVGYVPSGHYFPAAPELNARPQSQRLR